MIVAYTSAILAVQFAEPERALFTKAMGDDFSRTDVRNAAILAL